MFDNPDIDELNHFLDIIQYPLESSEKIFKKFTEWAEGESIDYTFKGNAPARFLYIPGTRKDKALLVAHADTWWDQHHARAKERKKLNAKGADDRAGCAILWILRSSGHSLLITDGEENSSDKHPDKKGSLFLRICNKDLFEQINREHQFAIQFDRCRSSDIKFYDVGNDVFKKEVKRITGYTEPPKNKAKTDICFLCRDICGVNISIGYYNEQNWDKERKVLKEEYIKKEEWLNTLNICREWLGNDKNLTKKYER